MKRITLPLPENRGNARWHWRTEARKKANYMLSATSMCNWRPDQPFTALKVHATLYTYHRMDDDNLSARMKFPMDWLEMREIVDNDRNVTLTCSQAIDRKNQRVELEISW